MTTFTELKVFRFTDDVSDKLWVIGLDNSGKCVTWYGRAMWEQRNGNTVCRLTQGGSRVAGNQMVLEQKKLRKGYVYVREATFDPNTTTVTLSQSTGEWVSDIPIVPSMIAIDCSAPYDVVLSACAAIEDRIKEHIPQYLREFYGLEVVKTIAQESAIPTSCDYEQGPLALCFLVALKRRINRHSRSFALFLDNGSEIGATYNEWSQVVRFMPVTDGFDLRSLAEAMGAIDPPINFRAMNSAVPAAFV